MSTERSDNPRRRKSDAEPAPPPADVAEPAPVLRRVLVVDDSDSIRRQVCKTLEAMPSVGRIDEAHDGLEALSFLNRRTVDLVITDVTMPRLDGFKFVSALRQNSRHRDIMVIVLSSRDDSVDKIRGLTLGANDYVTKPFEAGELQARVTVMFKMKELREDLQKKNAAMEETNEKLALLANQDGLTGIPNRRFFFERFEVEFNRADRLEQPLSVLMADLDRFKTFNDRYGHLTGDEALKTVANVISRNIRNYDLAARFGGEEFIAYLPQTECKDALVVAERLRTAVEKTPVLPHGGEGPAGIHITISIGIATRPLVAAKNLDDLVEAADRALYQAKAEGRNRCVVAGDDDFPSTPA